MHWKIARDPFYSELPQEKLEEAGFFVDSSTSDRDVLRDIELPTWPVRSLLDTRWGRNSAVIVLTGCFAPIHEGHVEMLKAARQELLAKGYDSVFCLLAPDHDEYVKTKTPNFPIDRRAPLIAKAVAGNENWLGVDWWAAYFNDEAINFTDILRRIKEQAPYADVFLACGADNARFALTFQNEGHCVIVGRGGYKHKYAHLVDNKRIFYAEASNSQSSSIIRQGTPPWFRCGLILRVDSQDWRELAVADALKPFYSFVDVRRSGEQFKEMKQNTISLDSLIPCRYNIQVSRLYDGLGTHKVGYCARVGSESLERQIEKIPAGEYELYDSDVFSGGTMNFVENLLKEKGIKISRRSYFDSAHSGCEILDARDFIFGHPNGGLTVVGKDGRPERAPYILPHVIPSVRASSWNSVEMSRVIMELNQKFF
jgi:nicotinic acid mononucleotide adenylyltransferase